MDGNSSIQVPGFLKLGLNHKRLTVNDKAYWSSPGPRVLVLSFRQLTERPASRSPRCGDAHTPTCGSLCLPMSNPLPTCHGLSLPVALGSTLTASYLASGTPYLGQHVLLLSSVECLKLLNGFPMWQQTESGPYSLRRSAWSGCCPHPLRPLV